MKITIENTSKIVNVNGIDCRVWEGQTETGIPLHCFITRVSVPEGLAPEKYRQFETELRETQKPSAAVASIPLRMIL